MSTVVGWRARWFAALWRRVASVAETETRAMRDDVLVDLPPRLVELGPGVGSNFARYAPGTTVIAVEPNHHLHDGLTDAARRHGIELDLRGVELADTGLPDASVEVVVCTLVLCSVGDPAPVLADIRRILAPGGRLLFVEHVAAVDAPALAAVQRAVRGPWRAIGGGCDTTARTGEALCAAGFTDVDLHRGHVGPSCSPTGPHVWGTARK